MSLAERIKDYCRKNFDDQEGLSLGSLSKELDEDERIIAFVLDNFAVDSDGSIHYAGPGAGGGWVPVKERTPEDALKEQLKLNVISQEDYDLRMELLKRGQDPRDAEFMRQLMVEKGLVPEDG